MLKLLIFSGILFFVYRLFIKRFLISPQANAPLDQIQDILSKLQQQQNGQQSKAKNSSKDDDYTDYEEIK